MNVLYNKTETQSGAADQIPLQAVNVSVQMHDALSIICVRHTYRNLEKDPIEAVFTFPVPLDGIILDVTITLGDKVKTGTVVEKKQAEERYEEAITDGDAAILLQSVEPGLYTMNVGNLLAGEDAIITFRYAQVNRWKGEYLRFHLPTVIAPRYGIARHQPHQIPKIDLLAKNEYSIQIKVTGQLGKAEFESPSHKVRVQRHPEYAIIEPESARLTMDRDFVLTLRLDGGRKSFGSFAAQGDSCVSMVAFSPDFPREKTVSSRQIKIVVDCSGSMGGDSIYQAALALQRIVEGLRPEDTFTIIKFGSHHSMLFPRMQLADEAHLSQALCYLREMKADMGGTEIGLALQAAFSIPVNDTGADVFLITDGEVWNHERIVEEAKQSRHRIFTIGVGSAVSEPFVKSLAEQTGGACELVSPLENMAEAVHRHFKRIYLSRAENVRLVLPQRADWVWPKKIGPVFDGDTVIAFVGTKEAPSGHATLEASLSGGCVIKQKCEFMEFPETDNGAWMLARIAAAHRLKAEKNRNEALKLALDYQLLCEHTNYLVVHEREDGRKSDQLPALRTVPHMLAAGWGGTGSVASVSDRASCIHRYAPTRMGTQVYDETRLEGHAWIRRRPETEAKHLEESPDVSEFSYNDDAMTDHDNLGAFIASLNAYYSNDENNIMNICSLRDMETMGLPEIIQGTLRSLIKEAWTEDMVVASFLHWLLQSTHGQNASRQTKRHISKMWKEKKHELQRVDQLYAILDKVIGAGW